jgi:hypothetical protein
MLICSSILDRLVQVSLVYSGMFLYSEVISQTLSSFATVKSSVLLLESRRVLGSFVSDGLTILVCTY